MEEFMLGLVLLAIAGAALFAVSPVNGEVRPWLRRDLAQTAAGLVLAPAFMIGALLTMAGIFG